MNSPDFSKNLIQPITLTEESAIPFKESRTSKSLFLNAHLMKE